MFREGVFAHFLQIMCVSETEKENTFFLNTFFTQYLNNISLNNMKHKQYTFLIINVISNGSPRKNYVYFLAHYGENVT